MIRLLFAAGSIVCGTAAALLFLGVIEVGVAAIIGIIGMGLIASSAFDGIANER